MSVPTSWREILGEIISSTGEIERIASEMGIRSITITRWVSGESNPRPQNLRKLLQTLTRQQRELLQPYLDVEQDSIARNSIEHDEEMDKIEYSLVMRVLETRATTLDTLRFWTISRFILQQALLQLDPNRLGMAITLAQCMPPSRNGKVRSLRESIGQGTPPWQGDLEHQAIFLGSETLAGYVVTTCHPQAIQDLSQDSSLLPAYQAKYEVSAMASPILFANRIAGCLLFSSTIPNYFLSRARLSLIADYTRLMSLAFDPEQFYPLERIDLHMMPPLELQLEHFATFRQRVHATIVNSKQPITSREAEQFVWQQIEEELIQPAINRESNNKKNG